MLVNLLENAARYAPERQHGRDRGAGRGEAFLLEVRDRGPGIPAEEAERIFDRFYRAPGAARGKGVGLGLAVARGFVEAMGGTISAVARPGGGTMFRLRFPADLIAAPAGEEPALAP